MLRFRDDDSAVSMHLNVDSIRKLMKGTTRRFVYGQSGDQIICSRDDITREILLKGKPQYS